MDPVQRHYIYYETGPAVLKSNVLLAGLKAALKQELIPKDRFEEPIEVNQGAEESNADLPGISRQITVSFDGSYRKDNSGTAAQRENAAGIQRNFLGLNFANAGNTGLNFNNGREGLRNACDIAMLDYRIYVRQGYNIAATAGDLTWNMISPILKASWIETVYPYKVGRDNMHQETRATAEKYQLDNVSNGSKTLWAVHYSVKPDNPRGLHGTVQEIRNTQNYINVLNEDRAQVGLPPIVHVVDVPYYMALPQKPEGAPGCFLMSPYEDIGRPGDGPIIVINSLAKSITLATPGVHIWSCSNDKHAAAYNALMAQTTGFSYFEEAMVEVNKMIASEQYPHLRKHFNNVAEKYIRNVVPFERRLGGTLLEHDSNMVIAGEVPENTIGKDTGWVDQDGKKIITHTARDVIGFMANFRGVVAVDQSEVVEDQQLNLVRYALKAEDYSRMEKAADGAAETFEYLKACPRAA